MIRYGYDASINGTIYKNYFNIADESGGFHIHEVRHETGIVFKLIEQENDGVSCRRLEIHNHSVHTLAVERACLMIALPISSAQLDYFTSDWGQEFTPVCVELNAKITIETKSGRSSHGCTPFFTVSGKGFGYYGTAVGWSGNWEASFVPVTDGVEVSVGLLDEDFSSLIEPGGVFENIEIYSAFSEYDAEAMTVLFRRYYRRYIALFKQDWDALPVEFNPWWPYEDTDINEQVFMDNVKEAGDLGFSHALLDAGWFGGDSDKDWYALRGDWTDENKARFPNGIAALSQQVHGSGIGFGIWCEIEAIGAGAKLYCVKPELPAMRDGHSLGYVCMGNPDGVAWAKSILIQLIETYKAVWVKLDFNLDPGLGCNCVSHGHGSKDGLYAHYKGYYAMLEWLHQTYPDVIIENCSSGGLRLDWGLMKRSHLAFLSDPDYTVHHLQCLWGALSFIHPGALFHFTWSETKGDHNQGVHAPITDHTTPEELDYMVRAAMIGVLGFSLKLSELPAWTKERIKTHVAYYRRISADYILNGDCWRLTPQMDRRCPSSCAWNAYQLNAHDHTAVVFVFKAAAGDNHKNICLRGLDADRLYLIGGLDTTSVQRTGRQLMTTGLDFFCEEDIFSTIIEITS